MNVINRLDNLDDFLESYLHSYGIEDIDSYINPVDCYDEPWLYINMKQAVESLHKHKGEKVCIVIDSDLDGCSSAAVQYQFLKHIGCEPVVLFHTGKQHGTRDVLEQILESDCSLAWIADAGTNDVDECKQLREANIDVICTDHHQCITDNPYAVIINNQISPANQALSGCGVTNKLVQAYCETYDITCPNYTDLVAISIISDMCDLRTIENRTYVHEGLNNPTNPFIALLLDKECIRRGKTPEGVGWCIAPLANALSRVDEQESKLLFFDALVGRIDAETALKDIKRVKRQQDTTVKEVVDIVEPTLDLTHKSIIGFTEADTKGYIGLIANKFCGKHHKPTILLRELNSTTWSGSLRSPIPLLDIINESKLAECSGHQEACGITVKKSRLKKLQAFLETLDLSANPDIEVAATIKPKDITINLCNVVETNKELWGQGLPCPQFHLTLRDPEVFVFEKKTTTIKLQSGGVDFLLFFAKPEDVEALTCHEKASKKVLKSHQIADIIVTLGTNEYNGVISPQGIIQKYEVRYEEEVDDNWENWF